METSFQNGRNPSLMRAGFHRNYLFMNWRIVLCRNPSLMRAGFHFSKILNSSL
ncbi:MAG: hypothetical protein ACP5QP_08110 [Brevinematia bacterium]